MENIRDHVLNIENEYERTIGDINVFISKAIDNFYEKTGIKINELNLTYSLGSLSAKGGVGVSIGDRVSLFVHSNDEFKKIREVYLKYVQKQWR